jgi:CRP-like cAMP-binding protein
MEATPIRQNDAYQAAYFPAVGLISLVTTTEEGHNVELAAVGAEGAINAAGLALQVTHAPYHALVAVASTGHRIDADRFLKLLGELPAFRDRILHYAGEMLVGTGRAMACGRFHSVHQRLAKWLLLAARKAGPARLSLTHDILAQILGGPRHAITAAMRDLRAANAITYARGTIEVVDPAVLEAHACECHKNAYRGTAPY